MKRVDVAVVGGGPAGLATALSLLKIDSDWADRLVVLEKGTYPRHKLCAGGLTPFALRNLRRLGLRLTVPFVRIARIQFKYGERHLEVPGQPAFVVTRRAEFDHWLAEQAKARGVNVLEGMAVNGLRRTPEGILLETEDGEFMAQVVIGADGSRGVVRRWIDARENPPNVARLLETVTAATGREPEYREHFARFDFSPTLEALQGYYWDFPSLIQERPFMNRGVYDGRVSPKKPKAPLPQVLEEYAQRHGADPEEIELEGHPIRWFSPRNRVAAERVLLVGDAAGAEPLFGEGIGPALGHSRVAADAIQRAFQRRDFGFGRYRWHLLFSPVGAYLLLRWAVAHIAYQLSGRPFTGKMLWWGARFGFWVLGSLPRVEGVLAPPEERQLPG